MVDDGGGLTRDEVAERAGIGTDEIDELIEFGMLIPGPGGDLSAMDAKRASVLHSLREAGLPMEGLAGAFRTGALTLGFLDQAAYGRFATYSDETFEAASVRSGVPMDVLLSVREIIGSAPPKPTDRLRDDELPIIDWIALQHANGFRPAAISSFLRAMGDSLRRIAESAPSAPQIGTSSRTATNKPRILQYPTSPGRRGSCVGQAHDLGTSTARETQRDPQSPCRPVSRSGAGVLCRRPTRMGLPSSSTVQWPLQS